MLNNNQQNGISPKNLRIFFLTSNDKTFLPLFFDKVFSNQKESIIEVAAVEDPNFIRFLKNSLYFMGPWSFGGEVIRQIAIRIRNLFYWILKPSRVGSIKNVCDKYNIPFTHVKRVNNRHFREYLSEKNVNLIVSIACPQILKKALLNLPSNGCINIHYGLLPKYRGLYPSFWVLANGESETGVTVHYMAEKIDAGDILVQLKEKIDPDDSFYSLVRRLKTTIGPEAIIKALEKIRSGDKDVTKNEYEKGSYYSFPTRKAMKDFRASGRKWFS